MEYILQFIFNAFINVSWSGLIFYTFILYVTTSIFFFINPHYLHKRKVRKCGEKHNFVVVSHRGGAGENVENTLAAFNQ
jgi:hypothetical protein